MNACVKYKSRLDVRMMFPSNAKHKICIYRRVSVCMCTSVARPDVQQNGNFGWADSLRVRFKLNSAGGRSLQSWRATSAFRVMPGFSGFAWLAGGGSEGAEAYMVCAPLTPQR